MLFAARRSPFADSILSCSSCLTAVGPVCCNPSGRFLRSHRAALHQRCGAMIIPYIRHSSQRTAACKEMGMRPNWAQLMDWGSTHQETTAWSCTGGVRYSGGGYSAIDSQLPACCAQQVAMVVWEQQDAVQLLRRSRPLLRRLTQPPAAPPAPPPNTVKPQHKHKLCRPKSDPFVEISTYRTTSDW